MPVDLELSPKQKRPAGEPCCEPVVYPDVERDEAERMAAVAKALGDPIRLQLVDVLRKHAGKVCVCELVPLFDLSQPTVSHHLKVLREAGIVGSERRGPVGLLLRQPRGGGGAERMAERMTAERRRSRARCASATPKRAALGATRGARAAAVRAESSCGCGTDIPDACEGRLVRRRALSGEERDALPDAAKLASLGCGNPTAVAELHAGETVLDLGSGGGIDVLLSARRVGPSGKAYGLDMTDEMLALARRQPAPRPGWRTSSSSRARSRRSRCPANRLTWSSPTA